MFVPPSVKLSLERNRKSDEEKNKQHLTSEQIEKIARTAVVDLTKLYVIASGTLKILDTTLKIAEHHLTK